ncbi:MAG: hypothetical protein AB8B80_06105 [Marinicellaceae bacterium]
MSESALDKYLERYAENEVIEIDLVEESYDYVLVIPICNEPFDCLKKIFSGICQDEKVLVILVVNSPDNSLKPEFQTNNTSFIESLVNQAQNRYTLSEIAVFIQSYLLFDIVLINKNSQGNQIKTKQGVGMARKIGCDLAVKYYRAGKIKAPWIFSTDADVVLPANYFEHMKQFKNNYSAIVLDFEHISNDINLLDLQYYYDLKIRYYHAGLVYAGSDYDYIPLGSTLIANLYSYIQVRGFPKKNAGEDFYLLNKLAKIKPIRYNKDNIKIKINSRLSDRVPFGTGPALLEISALNNVNQYKYYHPHCFELLKEWLQYLKHIWTPNGILMKPPKKQELSQLFEFFKLDSVLKKSKSQITSRERWLQFIHQWFDAFKTLKAVHFFDKNHKRLNNKQLLNSDVFAKVRNPLLHELIQKHEQI